MLTVTDGAKRLLKETLEAHTDDPETTIRLAVKEEGQLGIILDTESEGDQVVEHEGARVLLVSSELATDLQGSTLDIQETADGQKLIVTNEKQNNSND